MRKLSTCAILLLLAPVGCSRHFFRERTDKDVIGILTQKNQYPQWGIESFHVYPDPRARFADPSNPDRPPMPPDDPAAQALSPNPQRPHKAGVGLFEGDVYLKYLSAWDAENRAADEKRKQGKDAHPGPYGAQEESEPPRQMASLGAPRPAGIVARALAPAGEEQSQQDTPVPDEPNMPTDAERFENVFRTRERPFRITFSQASELALFNSRDYQTRREDLYLAALPVSLERFAFAAQFFATTQAIREKAGREAGGATPPTATEGPNNWQINSATGVQRLFPSGALLLVQLANRLVIDLADGARRPEVGISTLSMNLTQPLLRGGGFAVNMEPLTQAERSLLYGIRSFARYRKFFYVYLAAGLDLGNGPYGLDGLGGIFGGGGILGAPGQGYLPTLLIAGQEQNEARNVQALTAFLRAYEAYERGGEYSRLQVDTVESQLLDSRSTLLQRRQNLRDSLDSFKLQLGVPTAVPLELDDGPLRPLLDQLARYDRAREEFNATRLEAINLYPQVVRGATLLGGGGLSLIELPLRERLNPLFTQSPIARGTRFAQTIVARRAVWEGRTNEQILAELVRLDREIRRLRQQRDVVAEDTQLAANPREQARRLEAVDAQITAHVREGYIGQLELALRSYARRPWLQKGEDLDPVVELGGSVREIVQQFSLVLGEARSERLAQVEQAWPSLGKAELEGVDLISADLDQAEAVAARYAVANRLDLMNARGELVDSWRQVAVRANFLLGVLNIGYNFNTSTPAGLNRPLDLGGSRSRHQLTLNGELPLVRRSEALEYRAALISYQRQRRTLQATEDFIVADLRSDLRQLRFLAESYRIQQRSVSLAFANVENSVDAIQQPPDPAQRGGAGNAAALTQQLLQSQQRLVAAQNRLYGTWIQYLIARMQLYRDLELLPLDARGVWTDDTTSPDRQPDGGQRLAPERQLPAPRPGGAEPDPDPKPAGP